MAFATKSMDNEFEYELVKFLKIIRAKDFLYAPSMLRSSTHTLGKLVTQSV